LLEEVNLTAKEAEEEAQELRNAEQLLGRDLSGEVTVEPPPSVRVPVTPSVTPGGAVGAPPAPERPTPQPR
jgi:hypothetical protein